MKGINKILSLVSFVLVMVAVFVAVPEASGSYVMEATGGVMVSASVWEQFYHYVMSNMNPANYQATVTDIRVEVPLSPGKTMYQVTLKKDVAASRLLENRLAEGYEFVPYGIAMVTQRSNDDGTTQAGNSFNTHADASVFTAAGERAGINILYNAKLHFKNKGGRISDDILTHVFKYQSPEYGPDAEGRGYWPLHLRKGYKFEENAGDTIVLNLPEGSTGLADIAGTAPNNNVAVFLIRGVMFNKSVTLGSNGLCATSK